MATDAVTDAVTNADAVRDALRMALMDSRYLVSPRARVRGLKALESEPTPEANAARVILRDGGAQQGLWEYCPPMDQWRDAVTVLEEILEEGD